MKRFTQLLIASTLMFLSVTAFAQGVPTDDDTDGSGSPNKDPIPTPPSPVGGEDAAIEEQAGVGGLIAYSSANVLELGGRLGLTSGKDFTQVRVSPTIGWFFIDNLELSFLPSLNYVKAAESSHLYFDVLIEPSFHLPINKTTFVFLGLGGGFSYDQDLGAGLAVAPRAGMNFTVGRSGILTPAVNFTYSTTDTVSTSQGTLLAVSSTFGIDVGYTVMW